MRADPFVAQAPVFIARRLAVAAEAHAMAHRAAAALPEILKTQPGARHFALRAVLADYLGEDAVVVANAISGRRVAKRRERIEKAGGEPAETAVAKSGVFFFGRDPVEIVTEGLQRLANFLHQAVIERGQRIDEAAAQQKLHREIADAFHARSRHAIAGRDPAFGEFLADGECERVVDVAAGCGAARLAERSLQSIDDGVAHRAGAQGDGGADGGSDGGFHPERAGGWGLGAGGRRRKSGVKVDSTSSLQSPASSHSLLHGCDFLFDDAP